MTIHQHLIFRSHEQIRGDAFGPRWSGSATSRLQRLVHRATIAIAVFTALYFLAEFLR